MDKKTIDEIEVSFRKMGGKIYAYAAQRTVGFLIEDPDSPGAYDIEVSPVPCMFVEFWADSLEKAKETFVFEFRKLLKYVLYSFETYEYFVQHEPERKAKEEKFRKEVLNG